MARYTGPSCKLCRREGKKLFLKGDRCLTDKCAVARRTTAPGQHGAGRKNVKEYGLQLREKQSARRYYGVQENQFKSYYVKADKKEGVTGENLLSILETRFDNIVYRMGLSRTRSGARQLVNHGHILVDGNKVDIPSYRVKPGQVISLREKSRNLKVVKESLETLHTIPAYVTFDNEKREGTYVRLPERSELSPEIDESLIVEYYNRLG